MKANLSACSRGIRIAVIATAALVHLVLFAPAALAHRVNVFAWVEGDTVFVECKYPDGKRVNEGLIRVLDSGGAELLNGKTDANGAFAFKIPKPADLTVVLEAGMGHRAEWAIAKGELSPGGPEAAPAPDPQAPRPSQTGSAARPRAEDLPKTAPPAEEIERAIERAFDRKIAPVLKMLADSRDAGPRLTDVLGGIGYILGLVGVAAFFKSRKSGKMNSSKQAG